MKPEANASAASPVPLLPRLNVDSPRATKAQSRMAKQRMHRSAFIKLVKEQLPDLREAINKERQIFGFELMQLTKCAQRAIHDEDRERFEICVRLAEQAYLEGGKRLKKMIDTMFMEPLEFVTPKRSHYWAWEMTPDCLKDLYVGRVPDKPEITWKPARR